MDTGTNNSYFVNDLPFLQNAIAQLLNQQEKSWGYFKVKKENDQFYRLSIPYYPTLWWYQKDKTCVYEAYWQERMPILDRTRTAKAAIFVRKKTKKVYSPKEGREKKQRIFDIVRRYYSNKEIQLINTMLADFIKQRIEQNVIQVSHEEMLPLAIITEEV